MERALWNNATFTAIDISKSYDIEKSVRIASKHKELRCPDPDCPSPILRYCHGEKKDAYFAHLNNCACDYDTFDKENTPIMRQVKRAIYENFLEKGFDVQLEAKILPKHYTHLLFTLQNGEKIALELGSQRTTVEQIEALEKQYRSINVKVKWIVIDGNKKITQEDKTYFIKRYSLNESERKDVLLLDLKGETITQYIIDTKDYTYNGSHIYLKNYSSIFCEEKPLSSLTFNNADLCIDGFYTRYETWLIDKKHAFDLKIEELYFPKSSPLDSKKSVRVAEAMPSVSLDKTPNIPRNIPRFIQSSPQPSAAPEPSYEERRKSILHLMNQETVPAIDSIGKRWHRCEKCGAIETSDKFWTYKMNRGECKKCEPK